MYNVTLELLNSPEMCLLTLSVDLSSFFSHPPSKTTFHPPPPTLNYWSFLLSLNSYDRQCVQCWLNIKAIASPPPSLLTWFFVFFFFFFLLGLFNHNRQLFPSGCVQVSNKKLSERIDMLSPHLLVLPGLPTTIWSPVFVVLFLIFFFFSFCTWLNKNSLGVSKLKSCDLHETLTYQMNWRLLL